MPFYTIKITTVPIKPSNVSVKLVQKIKYLRPTPEKLNRMKELFKDGKSPIMIAKELKCTLKTIKIWQRIFMSEENNVENIKHCNKNSQKISDEHKVHNKELKCNLNETIEKTLEVKNLPSFSDKQMNDLKTPKINNEKNKNPFEIVTSKHLYFRATPKVINRMKNLIKAGKPVKEIAKELNCTTKTIEKWRKKFITEWKDVIPAEDRRKYNRGRASQKVSQRVNYEHDYALPITKVLKNDLLKPMEKSSEVNYFKNTSEKIEQMKELLKAEMKPINKADELNCSESTELKLRKNVLESCDNSLLSDNQEINTKELAEAIDKKNDSPFSKVKKKQAIPVFRPSQENIEHMKSLLEMGVSPLNIALKLNCSETTVLHWRKKFIAEWEGVTPAMDRRTLNKGRRKITDEQLALAVKELKCNPKQTASELSEILGIKVDERTLRKTLKKRANFVHENKVSRAAISDDQLKLAIEELKRNPNITAEKLPKILGIKCTGKTMRKALKERANFMYQRKFRKPDT